MKPQTLHLRSANISSIVWARSPPQYYKTILWSVGGRGIASPLQHCNEYGQASSLFEVGARVVQCCRSLNDHKFWKVFESDLQPDILAQQTFLALIWVFLFVPTNLWDDQSTRTEVLFTYIRSALPANEVLHYFQKYVCCSPCFSPCVHACWYSIGSFEVWKAIHDSRRLIFSAHKRPNL